MISRDIAWKYRTVSYTFESVSCQRLLAEKQAEYERYKAYRQEMLTYETVKQNVNRILGAELAQQKRQMER